MQPSEFRWYDWIYFRDNAVTYPDDKWVVGLWLSPSIDVGPALCAKILKVDGQQVYCSTYHHVMEDEWNSPEERKKHKEFNVNVKIKLGPKASPSDFEKDYMTPEFECYKDDVDGIVGHTKDNDDQLTSITFDQYLSARVVLPKGDEMVTGKVIRRNRDSEG